MVLIWEEIMMLHVAGKHITKTLTEAVRRELRGQDDSNNVILLEIKLPITVTSSGLMRCLAECLHC